MVFDVAPIVPEAREIVLAVAQIYQHHFRSQMTGLLIHGSAYKGGYIRGCSDIDLQLYLAREAFEANGALPLAQAMAIQRELALIDPAPFQYIQTYARSPQVINESTHGQINPISGAYHMVYGVLPLPPATDEEIRQSARETLVRIGGVPARISQQLLEHGGGRLERNVRFLCTDVWPALYSVLTLQVGKTTEIWSMSKIAVMDMLPRRTPMGLSIRRFYQCLLDYYSAEHTVEGALAVIEQGTLFLDAATQFAASLEHRNEPGVCLE